MSLLELVVVAALFGIVATLVVQLIVPAMHSISRGNSKSQAQQDAMLVIARITRELYFALPDSVSVSQDGISVIFLSAIDPHTDGLVLDDATTPASSETPSFDPLFDKREVLFFDAAQHVLDEQEIPLVPPATNPEPLQVTTFTPHDPGLRERVIARNLVGLKLQLTGGTVPLQVSVDTQVDTFTCHMESSGTSLLSMLDSAKALSASPTPLPAPTGVLQGAPLFVAP